MFLCIAFLSPFAVFAQWQSPYPDYNFVGRVRKCVIETVLADGTRVVDSVSPLDGKLPKPAKKADGRLRRVVMRLDSLEKKSYGYYFVAAEMQQVVVTTYDYYNLPVKEVVYVPQNQGYDTLYSGNIADLVCSRFRVYNNSSQLIQEIKYEYDNEGVARKTVLSFSAAGKVAKIHEYDPDDELVSEAALKYDKRGNLAKKLTVFRSLDTVEKHTDEYRYTYDKRGNWVEKRTFANGEPIVTVKRTIEYEE